MDSKLHQTIKSNQKYISKESEIIPGQHRLFMVRIVNETNIILEDWLTKDRYPYKKLYLPPNDPVVMKVRSYLDGNLILDYSILNDYSEGETYEFDVLSEDEECMVIENIEHIKFKIPRSFKQEDNGGKRVSLKVKELDLIRNRLIFENLNGQQGSNDSFLNLLEFNKLYPCVITETNVDQFDRVWLKVNLDGREFSIKGLEFQKNAEKNTKTYCRIRKGEKNEPIYLEQDRYSLISSLYQARQSYSFKVVDREVDTVKKMERLRVRDDYGFTHFANIPEFIDDEELKNVEVGNTISLFLNNINNDGRLHLFINTGEQFGDFYSVELIFSEIGTNADINEFFWDLEAELNSSKFHHNKDYANIFTLYNTHQNLWILAYLNFLENYIGKLIYQADVEKALSYVELYIAVEEWLINSEFINAFKPEKRLGILKKASEQLYRAKIKLSALELINNGEEDEYIARIYNQLKKRISSAKNDMEVFKEILICSPNTSVAIDDLIGILIFLIQWGLIKIDEYHAFYRLLEKRLSSNLFDLDQSFMKQKEKGNPSVISKEIIEKEWWLIIRIIALQIFLSEKVDSFAKKTSILKSARMCRYLAMLNSQKDLAIMWLSLAVKLITHEKSLTCSLKQLEALQDNISEVFTENSIGLTQENQNGAKLYEGAGAIYNGKQGWAILSSAFRHYYNHNMNLDLYPLAEFFEGSIEVCSLYNVSLNFNEIEDINQYAKNWDEYYQTKAPDNLNTHLALSDDSDLVLVRVKAFGRNNDDYVFCSPVNVVMNEGVMHTDSLIYYLRNGFKGILEVGDMFFASVNKTNRGLDFSFKGDVFMHIRREEKEINKGVIKITQIKGKFAYYITEKGLLGRAHNTDEDFEKGKYYAVEFFNNPDISAMGVRFIQEAVEEFDEKIAFRKFLEKNIFIKHEKQEIANPEREAFFKDSIEEILVIIETMLFHYSDSLEKQLPLLYLGKLMGSISRSHKSYFFDEVIKYYQTLYRVLKLDENQSIGINHQFNDQTLKSFPVLNNLQVVYDLMSHFNKPKSNEELLEIRNSIAEESVLKIVDLIIATNIYSREDIFSKNLWEKVKQSFMEQLSIHNLFKYSHFVREKLISDTEIDEMEEVVDSEENDLLNLGKEGKHREFKTSIYYFAGSSGVDKEKQKNVILKTLAGFLNSSGGSLFIGVNDMGQVVGLENDYQICEFGTDADNFERFVRKLIIEGFNKDISGVIELVFHKTGNLEYLEMVIPAYEQPVFISNRFYQRQGNETRLIEGDDLAKLLRRKFEQSRQEYHSRVSFEKDSKINVEDVKELHASEYNVPNTIDEEEKLEYLKGEGTSSIATSTKKSDILAYFYLLLNGNYIVSSKELSSSNNILAKEIIRINHSNGYIFFCYDDACINKVRVRTLLNKTFGREYKNGMNLNANIKLLKVVESEMLLQINSIYENKEYVKVIDTLTISTHNHTHLKGNAVVQTEFDYLDSYTFYSKRHKEGIGRLFYESKLPLGKPVGNPTYATEFEYLNKMFNVGFDLGSNKVSDNDPSKSKDHIVKETNLEDKFIKSETSDNQNSNNNTHNTQVPQDDTKAIFEDSKNIENTAFRYLNYLKQGGYCISLLPLKESIESIPIHEEYKHGFLYQFFNNGKITKISVQDLLKQNLDTVFSKNSFLPDSFIGYEMSISEKNVGVSFILPTQEKAVKVFPSERINNYSNPLSGGKRLTFYNVGLMFKLISAEHNNLFENITFKNTTGYEKVKNLDCQDQLRQLESIWPEIFEE